MVFTSIIPFKLVSPETNIIVKNLGQITKNEQQLYGLEITVTEIVKNLGLNFATEDESKTYTKFVDVESPWIGG
jgi:hypothetical protein